MTKTMVRSVLSDLTTQEDIIMSLTGKDNCKRFRCYRAATGEDGLCGPHRAGEARHAMNTQRWQEKTRTARVLMERQRMKAEFVQAWREAHSDRAYGDAWTCPLCGQHVQGTYAENSLGSQFSYDELIRAHTRSHGADWEAYLNAGG